MRLIEGNEAIAWGAYHAGCRFFAGYPITPATSVMNNMLELLPPAGGVVVQGEDEIASIGMCLGAAMAGEKAMTATSGPGISLYSENISFAIGSEIPLVIIDVMRLGPSTGSATRSSDGDVGFLRWSSSGGLPVICLVPVDVADCYTLTIHAFNLAERYRCPVFVAPSKDVGLTRESVDIDSLERPELFERLGPEEGSEYLPFKPISGSDVPAYLPIGGERLSRQTSSTHGENGYITNDPAQINERMERLERKIIADADQFTFYEYLPCEGAKTLVLTFGATARAAKRACKELCDEGQPTSLLVLKTIWPVPEALIRKVSDDVERVIVAEMNLGQYTQEVRRVLPGTTVEHAGGMDGTLIAPSMIKEAVNG